MVFRTACCFVNNKEQPYGSRQILLDKGADANAKRNDGVAPLMKAAKKGIFSLTWVRWED